MPKKISGADTGHVFRGYPKDNEHREVMVGSELCGAIREHMLAHGNRDDDLLFSTSTGAPISRNTFRTRVWLPAIERSGLRLHVRFHDLRGAHAPWQYRWRRGPQGGHGPPQHRQRQPPRRR